MPHTDRVAQIFDTFTCGVIAFVENKVVFANRKAGDMLGRPRESFWGLSLFDLTPPELHQLLVEEIKLADEGDLRARLTAFKRADGTTLPVLVLPMAELDTMDGDATGRIDLLIDLGAVMTAKHLMYDGEEQLRTALSKIAVDLQAASLLAGSTAGSPASHPELEHPELAELSKREREVLALLVDGDRVPGIAEKLFISPHTVRNHLKSMFRKLEVSSQAELIEKTRGIA